MEEYELYKWFIKQSPILQAFLGGLFTWILTAIGASLVFFFKSSNRKVLDMCLGFTGGVMIAASFWSLLSPAIATVEQQQELGITTLPIWFAPALGFLLGALFLYYLDKKIPHLHLFEKIENAASKLGLNNLSMGMSSDYLKAIKFNANFIRIGSKIFGKRN